MSRVPDDIIPDDIIPDDIIPDDRDWTWVLDRVCPECGFDVRTFDVRRMPELLRENAVRWTTVLGGPVAEVGTRPQPGRWSPLEYGCHVRDVFELYDHRLELMLTERAPVYPNWDQDATAIEKRYRSADPASVAAQLWDRADALATRFASVSETDWLRTGTRSDGASFTVETFARYLLHDPVHHLWDVGGR